VICLGVTISFRKLAFFAFSAILTTSSSEAPFFMSMLSSVGSKCLTLVLRLLIPLIFLGPVIKTKFLSTTSTMTHFLPASRPKSLTQILPTSMLGNVFYLGPGRSGWEVLI